MGTVQPWVINDLHRRGTISRRNSLMRKRIPVSKELGSREKPAGSSGKQAWAQGGGCS